MIYLALWDYRTIIKTTAGFSPYQLVHGVEFILLIESEIHSLNLVVEPFLETSALEERLVCIEQLDEQGPDDLENIEVNKCRVKSQSDKSVHPWKFSEGDLVLLYDQASEPLGVGKFKPMWHGPYVVKQVLEKGSYELVYYDVGTLEEPRNGLYLKIYYAQF